MDKLKYGNLEVGLHRGNMVSVVYEGRDYLHGGGKPGDVKNDYDWKGWQNSELVMFPLVGPATNYQVNFAGRVYPMDQHGIARYIDFSIDKIFDDSVILSQRYRGAAVPNKKFVPGRKNPKYLKWPFDYLMKKQICLEGDTVVVDFEVTNNSKSQMPYQFGWHPAFRGDNGIFHVGDNIYPMREVSEKGSDALRIRNADCMQYFDEATKHGFEMKTKGFRNFMLWSPPGGMFCMEPVTHLPGDSSFRQLAPSQKADFSVRMKFW